jgi:hypothetical protein
MKPLTGALFSPANVSTWYRLPFSVCVLSVAFLAEAARRKPCGIIQSSNC